MKDVQSGNMRTFCVLICSFSLVCGAQGGKEKQAKTSQHGASPSEHPAGGNAHNVHQARAPQHVASPGHPVGVPSGGNPASRLTGAESHPETAPAGNAAAKPAAPAPPAPVYHYNFPTKSGLIGRDFTRPLTPEEQSAIARGIEKGQPEGTKTAPGSYQYDNGVYHYNFPTKSGLIGRDFTRPLAPEEQSAMAREIENGQSEGSQVRPGVASTQAKVNPLRSQHFNLPSKPDPAIAGVKFEGTGHIPGSETWTDPKYAAFHNYHHEWHDKDWWTHHPNGPPLPYDPPPGHPITKPPVVIILVHGGWYWWHSGYWYPAWGYDRHNTYYPYDGPIYAYNGLAPDQVLANVQAALQTQGYYHGPINGLLDPATREALANYQRDHGLYSTSTIDEPTLAALGMA